MFTLRAWIAVVLSTGLALAAGEATAQTWPSRPIRFTVPLPPGGANDLLARVFAERLQATLGQPVVVENKPGAGGNVGTEFVARQPADGYSLLLSSNTHVVNVSFFAKLPYDPIKDFEPVTLVATIPFVLTVNSSLPVTSTKEFLAYLRSHPGSTYATAGIGTPHHLGAELLRTMTGVQITHVPYKGAAFLVPALLTGEVTFSIASMSSLVPHFKSGRLRALAVTGSKRSETLPNLPTVAESGLPGYEAVGWFGLLAPAATPKAAVAKASADVNRVLAEREVREKMLGLGSEPGGNTPEEFARFIRADQAKWSKLMKEVGIAVPQ